MATRRKVLPIENCQRLFKFLCPREWSQLERTESFDVRYCVGCNKNVYYCDSEFSLELHRRLGDCICVEVGVEPVMWMGEPSADEE